MADISRYLADILAAVYGEEVRGSIHDAIEIINDVSEVVLTTGTAVTSAASSSEGFFDNSLYLNTDTMELWKCIGTDLWSSQGLLKGDAGAAGVGIASIDLYSSVGLVDTYEITYTDGTTSTFAVTNGADGADGENGNKWYRGTAVSGKDVNPTVFVNSGIANANANDFYLNPSEGAVYHCVSGGAASVATWSYDFTMTGGGGGGTSDYNDLTNKPTIESVTLAGALSLSDLGAVASADLATVATSGSYNDLLNKPTIPAAQVNSDWNAISGIAQILNKPTIPAAQVNSDWNAVSGVAQILNKPSIPTVNDGTLTIQKNGVNVQTFTANQNSNATANIVADEWASGTTSVSGGAFTFSGLDDTQGYAYEPYIQVTGSSTNKNPTAQISSITGAGTASMSITYATNADEGASVKLRVIK